MQLIIIAVSILVAIGFVVIFVARRRSIANPSLIKLLLQLHTIHGVSATTEQDWVICNGYRIWVTSVEPSLIEDRATARLWIF